MQKTIQIILELLTTSKMANSLHITVGADPEFFLETCTACALKSAIGYVGGTKRQPKPLDPSKDGFFIQEDNVAVEFNIPPASTCEQFVDSIQWSMRTITKKVEEFGLRPRISAAELFPEPELSHPLAQVFGCDPDFNAWNGGRRNFRPLNVPPALRSCGGHIHVAVNKPVFLHMMIKAMDLFLGVPSVMMDEDTERRYLYGKAGSFRTTYYDETSWEYRVLSNFWIKSADLTKWAYTQTIKSVNFVYEKTSSELDEFFNKDNLANEIQTCINTGDVSLSHKLIQKFNLETA